MIIMYNNKISQYNNKREVVREEEEEEEEVYEQKELNERKKYIIRINGIILMKKKNMTKIGPCLHCSVWNDAFAIN